MKFCTDCGARVELRTPPGDERQRFVCVGCNLVHYQNPKLVVGCVPEAQDGRIVLCKRAIEPRVGYWTIPAGFMENGETLQQAAARESQEEALADVEIGSLLGVVNVTHAHQVHVFFRARLRSPKIAPGPESLEVMFVHEHEVPWQDIAFPSTEFALRRYFEDRAAKVDKHHFVELNRRFR